MNVLEKILDKKKDEVSLLKRKFSIDSFSNMPFFSEKSLSFIDEVRSNKNISIIAEIKKASPSKGLIRENFDHLSTAEIYFSRNVNAVSILTDKEFFQGDINFLLDIAKIKQVPLLRKDFIIDEIQVYEAKANGADIILLICEALTKNQIKEFTSLAEEIGLEVLLELHSIDQIDKIDFTRNKLIGVNNRNLNDFSVDLSTTQIISKYLPEDIILVSESGISNKDDIIFLRETKVNAILVGELLMSSNNIELKLSDLKNWCSNEG
ncbi:MAG: indole-3-glycerol phosphate synthase TrpC [Bacteroidetes bacterium]|nr:indole-3-glycerol phosphate synthase TrpC [Bacteroidota bacterium]